MNRIRSWVGSYDPNRQDRYGMAALGRSIGVGTPADPSVIQDLLERGGDPNLLDKHGRTPLYMAVNNAVHRFIGSEEKILATIRLLLDHGGNPNLITTDNNYWGYKSTPLSLAASWGVDPRVMQLLLNKGGDPNLVLNTAGHTPLYRAIISDIEGDESIARKLEDIRLMIQKGGDPNTMVDGCPLIDYSPDYETAKVLLDNEADPNRPCNDGRTPIMIVGAKDPQIAQLLIDRGVDYNYVTPTYYTAYNTAENRTRSYYDDIYGSLALRTEDRGRIDPRSRRRLLYDNLFNEIMNTDPRRHVARLRNPNAPSHIRRLPQHVMDRIVRQYLAYGRRSRRRGGYRSRRRRDLYK